MFGLYANVMAMSTSVVHFLTILLGLVHIGSSNLNVVECSCSRKIPVLVIVN